METSSKTKVISLKLLIDPKSNRFLFAEAGKDFVDFLFSLLHLPVGTVVRLLTEQTMAGTLGNLHESVQNLKDTYFQTDQTKDSVLNPKPLFFATQTQVPLLSLHSGTFLVKTSYYTTCPPQGHSTYTGNHPYFPDYACPSSGKPMSREIKYAAARKVTAVGEDGFVKGEVTYMVMDDLQVTPMSTSAWITMINKFNVREVGALEEKEVELGMPEAVKLFVERKFALQESSNKHVPRKHSGLTVGRYFSASCN